MVAFLLMVFGWSPLLQAESDEHWYQTMSKHVADTWTEGNFELYLPLKTYHLPFAYTNEQRENFTENPLGLGIGKGHFNSNGNYEGVAAMIFQDSHAKPEYVVGYYWIPTWDFKYDIKMGAGMMGFVSARSDFGHYIPFPGVLPVGIVSYKKLSLQATFIPEIKHVVSGNVIFVVAKWSFD